MMGDRIVRTLRLIGALVVATSLTACDRSQTPTTATTPPAINAFTGTWRSAAPTGAGACSSMNWTITPTGSTTVAIVYSATCSGVAVTGTGSGTLTGTTLNWSTAGTA